MEPIYGPYQSERAAHAAVIAMAGPGDPPMPSVLSTGQKWRLLREVCEAAALPLASTTSTSWPRWPACRTRA